MLKFYQIKRYSQLWNYEYNIDLNPKYCNSNNEPFNRILNLLTKFMCWVEDESDEIKIDDNVYNVLYNNLGFDSLDMIEFTMDVEKEFNISIPDSQVDYIIDNNLTFKDAIRYLNLK